MNVVARKALALVVLGIGATGLAEEGFTQDDFLGAVERVVAAIEADDYETFESYFSENTRGRQPDELWQGAFGLLRKFGKIRKVDFHEMDASGGAFVTVTFERVKRDVFVRLSAKTGRIRELTYVPPTNVHQ